MRGTKSVNAFLAKIAAWITAGYPEGVPGPDRVPLLALLNRRLTNDEVAVVAQDLIDRGEFDHVDIGVLITQTTDELPVPEDVERVRGTSGRQGVAARRPPRGRDGRPRRRRGLGIAHLRAVVIPATPSPETASRGRRGRARRP